MKNLSSLGKRLNAASCFLIISIVFGIFFVFATPLLWGADETTHFGRVYQITQGHLTSTYIGDTWATGYGGYIPKNLDTFITAVDADLLHTPNNSLDIRRVGTRHIYLQFGEQKFSKQQVMYSFPNTAAYSPVAYIPSVIGVFITEKLDLNMAAIIFAGRLCDLAFYIVCIYAALRILKFTRAKWVIFTVSLLPIALFQASIITADTVTNAVAIVFAALIIKSLIYKRTLNRNETITLFTSLVVLPLIKPTYIFLDFLILLVPKESIKLGIRKLITILALGLGLLGFSAWTYLTRGVTDAIRLMRGDFWQSVSPSAQVSFMEHHILSTVVILVRSLLLQDNTYLNQLIGWLGFDYIQTPAIAILASLGALALAFFLVEKTRLTKTQLAGLLTVLFVSVLSIFITLYITFTRVGFPIVEGVQGRYFIPFLPLLLVIPGIYLGHKFFKSSTVRYRFFSQAIVCLVVVSLAASAIKFFYVTWL